MDAEITAAVLLIAGAVAGIAKRRRRRKPRRRARTEPLRAAELLTHLARATGASHALLWSIDGATSSVAAEGLGPHSSPIAAGLQDRRLSDHGRVLLARAAAGEIVALRAAELPPGPVADLARTLGATEIHLIQVRPRLLVMLVIGVVRGCAAHEVPEHMRAAASRLRSVV